MLLSSILYEPVKFREVKQARWVKPEVTCSLIYTVRHNSFQTKGRLVRMMHQNGGKKRLHFIKIDIFFAEVHWAKNFDDMRT